MALIAGSGFRFPRARHLQRAIFRVLGAIGIVVASFFGTLYVLDWNDAGARDLQRAEHAKVLKQALDNFFKANRAYPVMPDNLVDDLRPALVGGGFLKEIPVDPKRASTGFQYRYVSNGRDTYGLLFSLERPMGNVAAGRCLTGLNTKGTEFWRQPPDCPF
jgi:hypothetical protein